MSAVAKTHKAQAERAMKALLSRLENYDLEVEDFNNNNPSSKIEEYEIADGIAEVIQDIETVHRFLERLDNH